MKVGHLKNRPLLFVRRIRRILLHFFISIYLELRTFSQREVRDINVPVRSERSHGSIGRRGFCSRSIKPVQVTGAVRMRLLKQSAHLSRDTGDYSNSWRPAI